MTPVECVHLVKFIGDRCPAMRMAEGTPEAWYVDLVEFDLPDALEAARRVTLDKTFIGIGDLVSECQAIVRKREGIAARARIDAEIAEAERGEVSDRSHPLRALIAGTPVKPAPRADWLTRHRAIESAEKPPPFTEAELQAAREALDAAAQEPA